MQEEPVALDAEKALHLKFDEVPAENRVRVYGVRYAVVRDETGGELYVTRYGWKFLENILPDNWYRKNRYVREGERLTGGTGDVFRVPPHGGCRLQRDLVVKVSRFAQDVPLHVASTFPVDIPREVIDSAEFNDPFREFGLLIDLRNGKWGSREVRIRTKLPLAIYRSSERVKAWQLNRSKWRFARAARDLESNQKAGPAHIHLEFDRPYLYLFAWVEGENAEEMAEKGFITESEMKALTLRVGHELELKGFRVLDNKPRHFIMRVDRNKRPLRHNGELVYALVDFELLQRTEAYDAYLREAHKTAT